MAFNFSQVEVEPTVESQGAAAAVETTRSAANPLRNAALSARFGIPHYSPAS
jgi:hypothetical protein